ncbi:hypothetical protein VPH35_071665 [Triticum aestivum]
MSIGSACSVDYVEPASKMKTATEVLAVWAWTSSPANVPRVSWVTLPGRNGGDPIFGRRGLEHRVIVHLSIHEDPTQGPNIVSQGYDYHMGIVDGETKPRDRRQRISRTVDPHRRDRDDDRDRGHRREDEGCQSVAVSPDSPGTMTMAATVTPVMAVEAMGGAGKERLHHACLQVALLCSPVRMATPSPTGSRPPGFEALPTPPLLSSTTPRRTPPLMPGAAMVESSIPTGLEALFQPRQQPLLPLPVSSPVKAPTHRRKTLASMHITTNGGFSLRRNSAWIMARGAGVATAMAKEAQELLCRSIGIVQDGEDITDKALKAFEDQFKEQLPEAVMEALRGLFKVDDAVAVEVEEALINHGGEAAIDHEATATAPSA